MAQRAPPLTQAACVRVRDSPYRSRGMPCQIKCSTGILRAYQVSNLIGTRSLSVMDRAGANSIRLRRPRTGRRVTPATCHSREHVLARQRLSCAIVRAVGTYGRYAWPVAISLLNGCEPCERWRSLGYSLCHMTNVHGPPSSLAAIIKSTHASMV